MLPQKGYDFLMKLGTKLIAGTTQHKFDITPNFEESIIKSDKGISKKTLKDVTISFSVSGLMYLNETADETANVDFEDLREIAPAGTELAFAYGKFETGHRIMTGNVVIKKYSEDTNSTDTGAFSLDLETSGEYAFADYSAS